MIRVHWSGRDRKTGVSMSYGLPGWKWHVGFNWARRRGMVVGTRPWGPWFEHYERRWLIDLDSARALLGFGPRRSR